MKLEFLSGLKSTCPGNQIGLKDEVAISLWWTIETNEQIKRLTALAISGVKPN